MARHIIEAMVYVEVDADSPETAYENFADGIDEISGLRTVTVQHVEQKEKPFDLPPGAERWRDVAVDIRYGDDRWESTGTRLCGFYDGSWWWTDGHTLLRCDGPIPSDENVWRRIPDKDFEKAFELKRKRTRAIAFSAPRQVNRAAAARRTITDPHVYVDAKYVRLGEIGVKEWYAGDVLVPVHGLDAEGRIMVVIAPMKVAQGDWDTAKVLPSESDPREPT